MKNIFLYIITFFIAVFNLSANSRIDSLLNELTTHPIDTNRINILLSIAQFYSNAKPDTLDPIIDEIKDLSHKLNFYQGLVRAENFRAIKYARMGEIEKSNEVLFEAIKLAEKYKQYENLANLTRTLGINYSRLGAYDKSFEYHFKSIDICKQHNLHYNLILVYIAIGITYFHNGDYEKTIEFYNNAIDVAIKHDFKSELATVYNNFGTVYIKLEKYDVAIDYIDKAISEYEKINDLRHISIGYHNKAALLNRIKKYEDAIIWLHKSIQTKTKINDIQGIAISHLALGQNYYEIKNYRLAIYNLEKAVPVFDESNLLSPLMEAFKFLDLCYAEMGDYKKAYEYSNLSNSIKDSLFNETKNKTIEELNTKYEVANKELENELLKNKTDKQFFIIIIIIIIALAIATLSFFVIIRNRAIQKLNKKLEENKLRIQMQNEELEIINQELISTIHELNEINSTKDKFFSIISHDLKGPLSSHYQLINVLIRTYKDLSPDEALKYLDLLEESSKNTFNLLENLLTWSRSQRGNIPFEPETLSAANVVKLVFEYLYTFANLKQIKLICSIKDDIEIYADLNMISTVIRNITTNAIKFSNPHDSINISYKEENNEKIISIADTGIGMTQEAINNLFKIDKAISTLGTNKEKGTGLGLIICKEFIDKHNGRIWVESEKSKGTTFYFSLNITPDNL